MLCKVLAAGINALRNLIALVGVHIFQLKLIGRLAIKPSEPLDRMYVGSLRRQWQVAQAHVVNQTTT